MRDISDRKDLEETLKEKTEELEMLLENIDTPILYLEEPGIYSYVNNAAAVFLGREKEEMRGKSIFDFFDKSEAEFLINRQQEVFKGKIKIKDEIEIKNSLKEKRVLINTLTPKLNSQGDVDFVVSTAHDITEIKMIKGKLEKINKKLKESERLFRINFEEAGIGMAIEDTEGNFVRVNNALCKILGYNEEELYTMNYQEIIHSDDLAKSIRIVDMLMKGEIDTANFENRYLHKTGKIIWVSLNLSMASDEEDRPIFFLQQIQDITAKKQNEEKIKQQEQELKNNVIELEYNKLKTRFFANLSHELRTPLNLIFSTLQIMKSYIGKNPDLNSDKRLDRYMWLLKQNGYRLLRLVNNVIDLTKIDSDSFKLNLGNHDIVEIVRQITLSVEDYVNIKRRLLGFNSDVKTRTIFCDPFNIERIILNLISNALKFTEEGDRIMVNISEQEGKIIISVKDTGIGISKEQQEIIFEQFRQVDNSFNRTTEGSGIGLSIVKSLTKLHGGDVRVESEPGEGSEFFIELPIEKITKKNISPVDRSEAQRLIDKIDVEFSDIYDL